MCSCEFVLTAPWVFPFCVWWLAPIYPEKSRLSIFSQRNTHQIRIRGAPHTLILGQALIYSANGSGISKNSDANLVRMYPMQEFIENPFPKYTITHPQP